MAMQVFVSPRLLLELTSGPFLTGMCGAELFPAGRGEDENPRGGAKRKISGAVLGGAGRKIA